jgi:hypothetical protein
MPYPTVSFLSFPLFALIFLLYQNLFFCFRKHLHHWLGFAHFLQSGKLTSVFVSKISFKVLEMFYYYDFHGIYRTLTNDGVTDFCSFGHVLSIGRGQGGGQPFYLVSSGGRFR